MPVSNCSCSANCRWSTYQYNGFVIFNSAKLIGIMVSLSSSGCLAIVKNQFIRKTSIFFIPTNFLCSRSCKNGPLANQPSRAQQRVLIPLEVHKPFRSDAWPTGAQESLLWQYVSRSIWEHVLCNTHYWPVIHPLLLWKNLWPFPLYLSLFILFLPYPYGDCFKEHQTNWVVQYLWPKS